MTASRSTALREVLRSLLPSERESLLLQACFGSKPAALAAWNDWRGRVGDPKSVFENDTTGLRGLLPFIRHALAANAIPVSDAFRVHLQVSSVREELRSRIYRGILADSLSVLQGARCEVIVLRAAALSETVYAKDGLRHNHAIELLVHPSRLQDAMKALEQLPFARRQNRRSWHRHSHLYVHETGLPVVLHTRLFLLPHYPVSPDQVWNESISAVLGGVGSRMLSPPDMLVHVCAHASYSRSRANLRWVCDAILTVRRSPGMSWNRLLARARQYRLALPMSVMFEYLAARLDLPIPDAVLEDLSEAAAKADSLRREAAIVGVMLGAATPVSAVRRLHGNLRAQLSCVRTFLFPSAVYMHWRYGVRSRWLVPSAWLYRFLKFAALPIMRAVRRRPARSRDEEGLVTGAD